MFKLLKKTYILNIINKSFELEELQKSFSSNELKDLIEEKQKNEAMKLYDESKTEILNNKDLTDDRKESLINKLKEQIFQECGIDLNQKEKSQEIKKENIEDENSTPKIPNIGE